MSRILNLIAIGFFIACCSCQPRFKPTALADPIGITPPAPDYSNPETWAALPDKKDPADRVPASSGQKDMQAGAMADVFFIHPTSYLKQTEMSTGWNAAWNDPVVNRKTDEGSILNQASVFNGAGRIYAPRYRQAYIYTYFINDALTKQRAFDTAYADVKRAFNYYLEHYNKGRPFIIASHSQGTTHAIRLMKEFLDGNQRLSEKLVAAYLVGMDVYDTLFTTLRPCSEATDSRCYVAWRTFAQGYYPPGWKKPAHPAVNTNPLTWRTDSVYAGRELNRGGVLRTFDKVIPELCDAQVLDGVLRINEPHFTGHRLYHFNNYHIVDYNLFYMNIRDNARERVRMFFGREGQR